MFSNASTFETSWSGMSAVGLCFYIVLGWYAFGDRRYLGVPVAGVPERRALTSRQIIATMNISISLLLGGIDVSLLIGGLVAMSIPPTNPGAAQTLTVTGVVLLVSLFMVHVFLITVALVLFVARARLLAKIEADREFLAALGRERRGEKG